MAERVLIERDSASVRLCTPTSTSMIGFAAKPGTAVLPICSMMSTSGPSAAESLARSCSNIRGQAGS
jgi:hypothetical protein